MKRLFFFFSETIPTFINCLRSRAPYNKSWRIRGRFYIIRTPWFLRLIHPEIIKGELTIGNNFQCNSRLKSNSIGVFQPCLFNISSSGCKITIGENVGISGSTINAAVSVKIGDNTIIGSGCLITDTDSHPVSIKKRNLSDYSKHVNSKPIIIGNNVFVGARSIILKGVTIGDGAVIGAGSIVTRNVPDNVVVAGNPAKIIREIKENDKENSSIVYMP